MTEEEWRASILRRVDRLESADTAMQKEINEIKTSVSNSELIVSNFEKMQAERFRRFDEKLAEVNKKNDDMIASVRTFSRYFWGAVIGGVVLWVMNGGLAV